MKYFSPSYWFKLWVLSAPLFKDKTQGINAMSIDNNQDINKDLASNNTDLQSINQELNFRKNTISNSTNNEIDNFYENFLKTQGWNKDPQIAQQQIIEIQEEHHDFLKHRHEKNRNRHKRENDAYKYYNNSNIFETTGTLFSTGPIKLTYEPENWEEIRILYYINDRNIINFKTEFLNKNQDIFYDFLMYEYKPLFSEVSKRTDIHPCRREVSYYCFPSEKENNIAYRRLYLEDAGGVIWNSWSKIEDSWKESGKTKLIKLKINNNIMNFSNNKNDLEFVTIENNTNIFKNKYLDNLQKDFPDYNKEELSLGIINDNIDSDIKNAIEQKYPNFIINDIDLVNKNYSHFSESYKNNFTKVIKEYPQLQEYINKTTTFGGFEIQLNIKGTSKNYSSGLLKTKFSYATKTKLNEISDTIINDLKVKQWIEDINHFNSTFPTRKAKLNSDINQWQHVIYNNQSLKIDEKENWFKNETEIYKNEFQNREKIQLNNFIRDWSYVSTLIEHELKIDELNKNVQGLKSSFDDIKNELNKLKYNLTKLDERVTNLENESNLNCGNAGWLVTSVSGGVSTFSDIAKKVSNAIPVIGNVVSAVSGIVAASCGLAGV